MNIDNMNETMGLLNILLMMKERITVIIQTDCEVTIDEPVSCLYDSEHQMVVFKCESRIDMIPFSEISEMHVIRKGQKDERIF